MPELPDIAIYMEALEARILGQRVEAVRLGPSPFLLRSIDPPVAEFHAKTVERLRRLGKRIAIGFEGDLWMVLHLMIAGRLHWRKRGASIGSRSTLLALDFPHGSLVLTEAGTQRRASLYLARGEAAVENMRRAGVEPLECSLVEFAAALRKENHTLKRSLTDPDLFSGIGNAYSDEILHRARMSPMLLTQKMTDGEVETLFHAVRQTLLDWTERLRAEAAGGFPEAVTAFRPEMAVHGRYGQPCPVCGAKVQRIRYASNETNYCAKCQTGGRLLADRALSRLLREDYPRFLED
ncbi:MAG: formamidopyrimidine-DNA glycosylase [Bryobacterales bacterium]|nr:formamidopyrimidine-DNA glycosylase [Bryobacterales bacterium]